MPKLVALHEKLASQGFDVVGVSVDKDTAALEEFLGKNEVPWTNLSGQEAFDFAKRLGIRGIPTMFLVDRDGKVLATAHSVDELAPQAEKLLEKPKAG
jgi:peroxiredoxin